MTRSFKSGRNSVLKKIAEKFFINRKTRFGRKYGDVVWTSKKERMKLKDYKDYNKDYLKGSYVITDLKGDLTKNCEKMLEENGYDVKVFGEVE